MLNGTGLRSINTKIIVPIEWMYLDENIFQIKSQIKLLVKIDQFQVKFVISAIIQTSSSTHQFRCKSTFNRVNLDKFACSSAFSVPSS